MQGRKYKAKDKILEDFLFQGQEVKDKPLRKQRKKFKYNQDVSFHRRQEEENISNGK